MMNPQDNERPRKRPVLYKSKTQIKESWAKLGLEDLDQPPVSEEHAVLNELYEDDLFGLGNE